MPDTGLPLFRLGLRSEITSFRLPDSLAGRWPALWAFFEALLAWDKLPQDADWKKDERFKAALRYLFDNTFTHTVVADLYPTFINPQYVRPGSMFMIIRTTSGHTQTLQKVDLSRRDYDFLGKRTFG